MPHPPPCQGLTGIALNTVVRYHCGMPHDLRKYDRTPHLEGSRLQIGDLSLGQVSIATLTDGHFLTGGSRERQYSLLKTWTQRHADTLFDILSNRYIMYGEWVYAKHTIFYDHLPHYFLEFDIFDQEQDRYLSTPARHQLLAGSPIVSVPVVHKGRLHTTQQIRQLIKPSLYKTPDWQAQLKIVAQQHDIDLEHALRETDPSPLAEGLYLKVEQNDTVIGRYKFIRPDFLQTILDSGSHWATRPILPNHLAPGVDLWAS
jgi:hypothetical protein